MRIKSSFGSAHRSDIYNTKNWKQSKCLTIWDLINHKSGYRSHSGVLSNTLQQCCARLFFNGKWYNEKFKKDQNRYVQSEPVIILKIYA